MKITKFFLTFSLRGQRGLQYHWCTCGCQGITGGNAFLSTMWVLGTELGVRMTTTVSL